MENSLGGEEVVEERNEEEKVVLEEERIWKGEKQLMTAITGFIGLDVISQLMNLFTGNFRNLGSGIVRLVLTCILCSFLYKGYKASKILTIILAIGSIIVTFPVISISNNLILKIYMYLVIGFDLFVVGMLFFSRNVREFLIYQQYKRENKAWWK